MVKRIKRLLSVLLMLVIMTSNVSYAREIDWGDFAIPTRTSVCLPQSILEAQDIANTQRRGRILSTAMLSITNEQDGTLYIAVNTSAHKNVDKIYQTVFLDQWDEEKEDWVQIGYWEFVRDKEEESDGQLSSFPLGFTVKDCQLNKYYRARAMHLVEIGDNMEGKATQTDGVLLTDHEV